MVHLDVSLFIWNSFNLERWIIWWKNLKEVFIIDKYVLVYAYVPEHFLSRKDLSYLDKLIYIRIVGFCRNDKYDNTCFASNGYFANLFGVKPKAISVTIKKLKDLDLINVKYIKNENLVKQRSITLTSNVWKGISNNEAVNKEEEITYMKDYNNKINNNKEIINKIISYDTDGVMLWHGKRCESVEPTEEERKEMEDLLSEFRNGDDLTNE